MAKEQEIVTQYNKAFLIGEEYQRKPCGMLADDKTGEYDWTGLHGGSTSLASFYNAVEVAV